MAKKEKKGGTRLSTLIICFATVAATASGLSAVFVFPWFHGERYPGFAALYAQERLYYLLHWQDRLKQKQSIKTFKDETCQAATEYVGTQFGGLNFIIEAVQMGAEAMLGSKCDKPDDSEESNPAEEKTESGAKEKKESGADESSGVACFIKNIATAPKGIFGCGYWYLCTDAANQRCALYRTVNILLTGTVACVCFGAAMGFLSMIFLFAENVAGKRKKSLTAARMKTFTCSVLGMLSIYIGALLAGFGWMFMLNGFRMTQQFPVPIPHVGVFACGVSILFSTCACACTLDRFYPQAWESICPCCSKGKVQVADEDQGEFFEQDDDGQKPACPLLECPWTNTDPQGYLGFRALEVS
eukprot:GEMP01053195.1.p1 GENE.GEMP01053195.1~~GEMP01053195.1.p1  ORF type:complete len:357 (+),score=48.02 GEMP01053195.1:243-1313(+)